MSEPLAQRGATRNRRETPVAEHRPELGVDQLVEQRMLGSQSESCPAGVLGAAPLDGGGDGDVEHPALTFSVCLLLGRVVDLLENPRHCEYEGWPELTQLGDQVLDIGSVSKRDPSVHAARLADTRENVSQWKEQQQRLARLHQRW